MKSLLFTSVIASALLSLNGFSQSISGEKEFAIGIAGAYYDRQSYLMISGSLNKKNHQVFSGVSYLNESVGSEKNKTYNLTVGYKGYVFNHSKIFRGFGILGGGGFYYKLQFHVTNCNLNVEEINYHTQGIILFWGLGGQFIIQKKIIVGLAAQLGWGHGGE